MSDRLDALLIAERPRLLAFLTPKVESAAVAEELLQQALVKGLERADDLRDEERAIAWIYRLLRNALVDHYRRRAAEGRALDRYARELLAEEEAGPEEARAPCRCVGPLVDALKPEYAQILRAVDAEGQAVVDVARAAGLTANNASVRLHRARKALRKSVEACCGECAANGCLDCTCGEKA